MPADMIHVLLIFDHNSGRLIRQQEFTDAAEATQAYSDAEAENRDRDRLEIVLVGSDSLATIHRTHGHYFAVDPARTPAVNRFLAGV